MESIPVIAQTLRQLGNSKERWEVALDHYIIPIIGWVCPCSRDRLGSVLFNLSATQVLGEITVCCLVVYVARCRDTELTCRRGTTVRPKANTNEAWQVGLETSAVSSSNASSGGADIKCKERTGGKGDCPAARTKFAGTKTNRAS